ncbi:TetR/AcrR family transcriptional regulator [Nonomuraea fuscirosea]|uniref:TetR/AcrR family transcriptional regulator n=1 Tax=Nonomuraea fuscirosea TaxID=1291556 RepID=UPI002DD8F224|nr:TetR/AcrR family transcriptional regulator [Nonomuraea fuscirosea]WSA52741.1 TetR/AcrR family transcriptional regulator [Nonomuraea fuscirosea]
MSEEAARGGGAPARADARRNRSRVLEAARHAFAEIGLDVPLDEIARRAGVGAGTVYRHFPSKEALFEAVVLEGLRQLTEEVGALVAAPDPAEAFFAAVRLTVERAGPNKALCDALSTEVDPRLAAPAREEYAAALSTLLDRAQRAGAVRPDVDPADVRTLLSGCLTMEGGPDGTPGRATAIVLDGLRPAPADGRPSLPPVTKATPSRNSTTGGDAGDGAAESSTEDDPRCRQCGRHLRPARTGRPARFCGSACRQKAHRRRTTDR